jgi:hypothetical protein
MRKEILVPLELEEALHGHPQRAVRGLPARPEE